jgi:glycosyltransferase involved in cell wall biosynthesis
MLAKSQPLISVVIPTHNRSAMLAEAVASVRAQTFKNYEIIVVSNGETEIAQRASERIAASHSCKYLRIEQGNRCLARNAGAEAARGEWIAILDDDDWWKPEKLEKQLALADVADVVFSDFEILYANGAKQIAYTRPPYGMTVEEGLLLANYAGGGGSSALIRRRLFFDAGGFDPQFEIAEDWDLWRRLSHIARIAYTTDVLHTWRQHQTNTSEWHWGNSRSTSKPSASSHRIWCICDGGWSVQCYGDRFGCRSI